jgi:hypothetical protein
VELAGSQKSEPACLNKLTVEKQNRHLRLRLRVAIVLANTKFYAKFKFLKFQSGRGHLIRNPPVFLRLLSPSQCSFEAINGQLTGHYALEVRTAYVMI